MLSWLFTAMQNSYVVLFLLIGWWLVKSSAGPQKIIYAGANNSGSLLIFLFPSLEVEKLNNFMMKNQILICFVPGAENQVQQEVLHFSGLSQTFAAPMNNVDFFIFLKKTMATLAQHRPHPGHGKGGNDPVLKWRVIPAKCHGWSGTVMELPSLFPPSPLLAK